MASTLAYYNHNHNHNRQQHHSNSLHQHTSNGTSLGHTHRQQQQPLPISSSAAAVPASTSAPATGSAAPPLPPASESLPVVDVGAAAAAATAASNPPSHPLPLSLSSWTGWPAEQEKHRRLGSDTGLQGIDGTDLACIGIGTTSTSSSVGRTSVGKSCTGSALAKSRSLAPSRHRRQRQRRSSSSRHPCRPNTSTTTATTNKSSSPPSSLRCGCDSSRIGSSKSTVNGSRSCSSIGETTVGNTNISCSPLSSSPPSSSAASSSSSSATTHVPAGEKTVVVATTGPGAGPFLNSTSKSTADNGNSTTMSGSTPRSGNKRSPTGSSNEDASPAQSAASKLKLPRLERGSDDFSSVVKNRLQSYTRTGQACDRCKVRKIRCDALPEGCSHCINLNLECYVTDRVTGRTERRGYMQQLEREKNGMLAYIRDLEKLLGAQGVEVKPWQGPASATAAGTSGGGSGAAGTPTDHVADDTSSVAHSIKSSSSPSTKDWTQSGSVWVKPKRSASASPAATASVSLRPKLGSTVQSDTDEAPTIDADSYEGTASWALKSIMGTRLTLLDMTIDTSGFQMPDMEEPPCDAPSTGPLYRRSFRAFLQSTFGVNPVDHPEMPSRDDAFTYCHWYFLVFSPFFPVLHKPTFLQMVTRMYDDPSFEPSAPDLCVLHAVFAMIYHNYGIRNWDADGRVHYTALADKHYHFALSKLHDVLPYNTLSAVQALSLLAIYIRSFPKATCAPFVVDLALQKAIDLGLHRQEPPDGKATNLTKEMRKRIWWSIMCLIVFTYGRLGRPMPVTAEQFDTELPDAIADEHISEDGVDATNTSFTCSFQVGLALQKLTVIALDILTHVQGVRCDKQQYPFLVEALEQRVQEWEASLPDSLRLDKLQQPETMMHAYYTRMFLLEVRLCLRHPSVVPASEPGLRIENTRITETTSREILDLAQEVLKFRAIDTTWYQISLFVVCIFSTLAIHWERRYELSSEQKALLREDMARWLSIIKDMSILMGCGPETLIEITRIVDRAVAWIEHDVRDNDVKIAKSSSPSNITEQRQALLHPNFYQAPLATGVPVAPALPSNIPDVKGFFPKSAVATSASYTNFPYGSSPANNTSASGYDTGQNLFYNTSAATVMAGTVSVAPGDPSGHVNPLVAYAPQGAQHVGPSGQHGMLFPNRGGTWGEWENSVAESHDRYSATTLPTLGTANRAAVPMEQDGGSNSMGQAGVDLSFMPASHWPMNLFDAGAPGGPSPNV